MSTNDVLHSSLHETDLEIEDLLTKQNIDMIDSVDTQKDLEVSHPKDQILNNNGYQPRTNLKLLFDPIKNFAECMVLASEISEANKMIFCLIKSEHTFKSDKKNDDEGFIEECKEVYTNKLLLEKYVIKVVTELILDHTNILSKKLPRLLLMANYTQKLGKEEVPIQMTVYDTEDGYSLSKSYRDLIISRSRVNPEFGIDVLIDVLVKRLSEGTDFEFLKKKILQFLEEEKEMMGFKDTIKNYMESLQKENMEKEKIIQEQLERHSKFRKG